MSADIDGAKVMLGHAAAALELMLNSLEQQLGDQGKENLCELEDNIGVRHGTLVAMLNLAQQEAFRAVRLLEEQS